MARDARNLFRLDDVLIRTGMVGLLAACAAAAAILVILAADEGAFDVSVVLHALARYGFFGAVAFAGPATLLFVGRAIRARERRILAIWRLLRERVRLSVPDLVASSYFTPEEIDDAVKIINTRGLGYYVWDRASGTIQDGRLETETLHVEECEVCGGSVSVQVPIGFDRIPTCPYCGDPVSAGELETRRKAAIDALRAEHTPERASFGSGVPFSIPLFAVLMFTFWPAGVAYAWYKCQNRE